MRIFKFEKDIDDRWYVVLPEWTGDRAELEMIDGADILLDILAQDDDTISVKMTEEHPGLNCKAQLTAIGEELEGMRYDVLITSSSYAYGFSAWLCHVTKFVFGYFPEKIYIS